MTPRVIFGGTFDPVTEGHRAVAAEAHRCFPRATLHLVPTAAPPHRDAPTALLEHRVAMLTAAFAGDAWARVDRREERLAADSPGPVHALDVVADLRREFGDGEPLLWVLGQDSFASLPSWYRWKDFVAAVSFIVIPRPTDVPGTGPEFPPELLARIERVPDPGALAGRVRGGLAWIPGSPLSAVSATEVRSRLASGRSTHGLLPPAVARYARLHGLYGVRATSAGPVPGSAQGRARAPGSVENHDA